MIKREEETSENKKLGGKKIIVFCPFVLSSLKENYNKLILNSNLNSGVREGLNTSLSSPKILQESSIATAKLPLKTEGDINLKSQRSQAHWLSPSRKSRSTDK